MAQTAELEWREYRITARYLEVVANRNQNIKPNASFRASPVCDCLAHNVGRTMMRGSPLRAAQQADNQQLKNCVSSAA